MVFEFLDAAWTILDLHEEVMRICDPKLGLLSLRDLYEPVESTGQKVVFAVVGFLDEHELNEIAC